MAEKCTDTGEHRKVRPVETVRDEYRDRALEHVAQQRGGGETLAAGTQHVGGADVAGADGTDVLGAGKPRQYESEWDRTDQVTERQRRGVVGQGQPPVDRTKHGETGCLPAICACAPTACGASVPSSRRWRNVANYWPRIRYSPQ